MVCVLMYCCGLSISLTATLIFHCDEFLSHTSQLQELGFTKEKPETMF